MHESFLEDVNNILNQGEIPLLFTKEEIDDIELDLRYIAHGLRMFTNIYNKLFLPRVRENLHIVLCMSPLGGTMRNRTRRFPSLVSYCTINWIEPWSEQALLSVATDKIKDLKLDPKEDLLRSKI